MYKAKPVIGFLILLTIHGCVTKQQNNDDKFHGMWRLEKFEMFDSLASKWTDYTPRRGYTGYIVYDGQGHMGVHLTPQGYKDFNSDKNIDSLSPDDLKALAKFYQSNFVYFADYTITDSTILHKRHSATEPRDWGTDLTRGFEFRNDTLILTTHEKIDGQKLRLRWIKL